MPLKDLPPDARPREKLLARGAGALSDAELLALLLRTGIKGKGVLQMADELLHLKKDSKPGNGDGGFDGISGLLHASADDLKRVKGLGPAKRAELVAVLELARRAMAQQLQERAVFADPDTIKHYLKLHLAVRGHEVFAVLFLDSQNRLLAMKDVQGHADANQCYFIAKIFWLVSAFHSDPVRAPTLVADSFVPIVVNRACGLWVGCFAPGVIEFDAVDISCGRKPTMPALRSSHTI